MSFSVSGRLALHSLPVSVKFANSVGRLLQLHKVRADTSQINHLALAK